jgi:hypothetical protein
VIKQAAPPVGLVLSDEELNLLISGLILERDRRHLPSEDWGWFFRRKGMVKDLIARLQHK